jgi:hypothetical protein
MKAMSKRQDDPLQIEDLADTLPNGINPEEIQNNPRNPKKQAHQNTSTRYQVSI